MPLDPAELRRLRLAMADLAGAAWYVSRIEGEAAQAIAAAILALLAECRGLMEG